MDDTAQKGNTINGSAAPEEPRKTTGLWRIGLSALCFIVVVLAACLLFINNIGKENRETVLAELNDYAQTAQSVLTTHIQGSFDTLNGIAFCLSEMDQVDEDAMALLLKQINHSNCFSRMGYASVDGKADMFDLNGSIYAMDFSGDAFFQQALSGENVLQDAVKDPHSNGQIVRYAVPVEKDGRSVGVLVAIHNTSLFSQVVDLNIWSGYGYANIVSSSGSFVIRATSSPLVTDDTFSLYDLGSFTVDDRQSLQSAIASRGGVYGYTNRSGDRMTAVVKPLNINGWHLVCALSDRYISAPYYDNAQIIVTVLIASLFLFMLLISLSMRMISRGHRTLRQQSEEHAAVIAQSGKHLLRYDTRTKTIYNLSGTNAMYGLPAVMENYPDAALEGNLIMPESQESIRKFFEDMRHGIPSGSANAQLRLADGSIRWHHADYRLLPDENGQLSRSIISFYDNTELREKELAYELRQNEMASLASESTVYLEANLTSGVIETIRGLLPNESFDPNDPELNLRDFVDRDVKTNLFPDDATAFTEFFNKNRLISLYALGVYCDSLEFRSTLGSTLRWNQVTIQMVKYPYSEDIKIYVLFKNIEEERRERELLVGMASMDALTGLLNREATMREIEKYLLMEGASGTHALFMVDVDNFKQVNDTLGHQVGDTVLADLAKSIRGCFRQYDIVGRIGGDEFFAFMKNIGKPDVILSKARELVSEMQYVCAGGSHQLNLSGSIGVTVYHGNAVPVKSINLLYAEADAALYKAKAIGKNCFAFADELDAVATAPAAAAAHGALALNLRGLLNNLGSGIEICHGDANGKISPLFCNEPFLKLLGGVTQAEHFASYQKDTMYDVHPEDRAGLREAFSLALDTKSSFQHTYRLKSAGGEYRWISIFSNFVVFEDGSFDVYLIYSDAEQAMRNRTALEERYQSFQNIQKTSVANTVAAYHLDLTANCCNEGFSHLAPGLEDGFSGVTAEECLQAIGGSIDSNPFLKEYEACYKKDALLAKYRKGEFPAKLDLPIRLENDDFIWLRLTTVLAENPDTHHIEALICFSDIDREKRLQYMVQRLLVTDYEFFGQVDVHTGRLTVFGGTPSIEAGQTQENGVDYREHLSHMLRNIVRNEFYEDSLAALKLDHIVSQLEHEDVYACTFPTKQWGGMREGYRQWRCSYVSERKKVIMISRTDITDTVAGERDPLTGLYNQQGFYRRVREELAARPDTKFRIHRFDFDDFKLINDTLGYIQGDQLLRDFGAILRRRAIRAGESVIFARLEADHFVSFRPESDPEAEQLIGELMHWLSSYPVNFVITTHMGVYHIEDPAMDVSAMCDRALLALRSIKGSFLQRVAYYDDTLRDKLVEEQTLSNEMEAALADGQFEIYFQPQFNYEDRSLISAEALVRWKHPTRGLISPGVFIPLFERNGFITTLDAYIWEKSCQYIRKWMDQSDKHVPVSVNISRIDIYNLKLAETLKAITERCGVPPAMLRLEITETAYMQNPEQLIRVVKELQAEGFTVEMDDFGSGYSSLNTLKDVPVDILKLDMRFLSHGDDDERGGNILSSVIRMAHWLKIPIIAEGVETKLQADYLKSLGCCYMQGYHFARPMPAAQFEALMLKSSPGTTDRYANIDLNGVAAFWNASAQTALLFNSFVGGAAILEYRGGNAEILRANDKFYTQLEITREEYLQKQLHTLERFEGEHRKAFTDMLEEAIRTGGEAECDVQSLSYTARGRQFWTHNRVRLLAKNGDSYLFYLATENITERKETEEQLRVNREALRLSISQMGRVICTYSISSRELTMPEAYAKKHGVPTRLYDIPNNTDSILPEDKEQYQAFYEAILRGEQTGSTLVRVANVDDKTYAWEKMDFVNVFSDDGHPLRAIITCEDVTAEKEREAEAVRNSVIIEHSGISVMDYDVPTDVMHFQSCSKDKGPRLIPGYLSDFLNTSESRIHTDDKAFHREQLRRLMAGQPEAGSYEYRANNWGVGYRWCRIHYVSIGDSNNNVYRIIGQISDIQKEKDDAALIERLNRSLPVQGAGYGFNATIAERIFALLYSQNATDAINRVLAVLGEQYDLSRAYIFEDSADHTTCSNTFEWCAPGISPEIKNLQNMSYEKDMGGLYHSLFDENGVFYCENIENLHETPRRILAPQGIKSMLQCTILDGGSFTGYIGFDECRKNRCWTNEQIGTLLLTARIVGTFLIKLRKQAEAEFSEDFRAALDNNASYIYIIDPETHEIAYNNKTIQNTFQNSYEGKLCYEEFMQRKTPCDACPIHAVNEAGEASNVEVLRPDGMLLLAQAAPLHWNDRDLMLITCVDITERHRLRTELTRKAASLQTLYDAMPCGILQYTLEEKFKSAVAFNPAARRMLGFSNDREFKKAIVNWQDTKHVHPEDLDFVQEQIRQATFGDGFADYEHRFLMPDGSIQWVRAQLQRRNSGKDDTWLMLAVFYDINERKRQELNSLPPSTQA